VRAKTIVRVFPVGVTGTKSPYHTLVSVMTQKYNALK